MQREKRHSSNFIKFKFCPDVYPFGVDSNLITIQVFLNVFSYTGLFPKADENYSCRTETFSIYTKGDRLLKLC